MSLSLSVYIYKAMLLLGHCLSHWSLVDVLYALFELDVCGCFTCWPPLWGCKSSPLSVKIIDPWHYDEDALFPWNFRVNFMEIVLLYQCEPFSTVSCIYSVYAYSKNIFICFILYLWCWNSKVWITVCTNIILL